VIDLDHQGDVAVLTLNHGKANALDIELCRALGEVLEKVERSSARALVVTGRGNIFCAGVDLLRALAEGPDYFRSFLPALREALEAIFFFRKPLVAAINGHAAAGGCILACAADRRLMARDSGRIGVTELRVGVPFPVVALEIMRFAVAPHRFEPIVFGAATFPPAAALDLGLIDEVVDPAALMERAVAVARELGAIGEDAFAVTKRQSRQPVRERLRTDGPLYDPAVDAVWFAPETSARIRDYVSRTFKKI